MHISCLALPALALLVLVAGSAEANERPAKTTEIAVVDAPSNLGLRPLRPGHTPGAWRLSTSLRANGFMTIRSTVEGGVVLPPAYAADGNPQFGFRHGGELRDYSIRLADHLGKVIDQHAFTILLGGDCSVLLGSGLALKQRGRYGLIFVDGHTDFPFPKDPDRYKQHGLTAAGLDLGLATGHGPTQLANLEGAGPLFLEQDVVALGYRYWGDDARYDLSAWDGSAIHKLPLDAIRKAGISESARLALSDLNDPAIEGIWVHLDADVLDPKVMPAVDSPEDAGGMTFDELESLMSELVRSPRVIGIEFTIFDPDLDPDGVLSRRWVEFFRRILSDRN